MSIDSPDDLHGLRRDAGVVKATLRALREALRPGVSTAELDRVARSVRWIGRSLR